MPPETGDNSPMAIAILANRVRTLEDQARALRDLPAAVAALRSDVKNVQDGQHRLEREAAKADQREKERIDRLHDKFDGIDEKLDEFKYEIQRVDWKTVLAVVTGITVPLLVAIVGAIVAFGAPGS